MKKSLYTIVLVLLSVLIVHAQEDDKPLYLYHTSVQFQELDFIEFNQQLEGLNLLSLPNNTVEIGAGATRLFRRSMTRLSFAFGSAEEDIDDITAPTSQFRYVGLRLGEGFNILNPDSDWFFGPEFMVNLSFQQILVTGRNNGTNFQEAALNEVYNFERFSETLDVGLYFHKLIRYNDGFEQPRTVLIGFRGGYRIGGDTEDWKLKKAIQLDNLGIKTGGWFGSIIFGINLY